MRAVLATSLAFGLACACPADSPQAAVILPVQEALRRTLEQSQELREALGRQAVRELAATGQIRSAFPRLNLSWSASDSVSYGGADSRSRRISAGIEQTFWDGGLLAEALLAGEEDSRLAALDLHGLRQELTLGAALACLRCLTAESGEAANRRSLEAARQQAVLASRERGLGLITELEFLDIELSARDLEIKLGESVQAHRLAWNRLAGMAGFDPGQPLRIAAVVNEAFRGLSPGPETEACAQSRLDQGRESLARRIRLERASRALQRARDWFIPTCSARFEFNVSGERYPLSQPGFTATLQLGLDAPYAPLTASAAAGSLSPRERSRSGSLSVEALGGFESAAGRLSSRLEYGQAGQAWRDFERDNLREVSEALETIRHRRGMLELLRQRLAGLSARHELTRRGVDLGQVRRMDYVKEEVELARERIAFIEQLVGLFENETSLLRDCGLPVAETWRHILLEASP